jgi:hypothetical protein
MRHQSPLNAARWQIDDRERVRRCASSCVGSFKMPLVLVIALSRAQILHQADRPFQGRGYGAGHEAGQLPND